MGIFKNFKKLSEFAIFQKFKILEFVNFEYSIIHEHIKEKFLITKVF